jgi:hypothetical protein
MRAEADRIVAMASFTAAPAEDGASSGTAAQQTWREISAAARTLDSWIWEANSENAPLTLREAAVLTDATPLTGDLRWDTAEIAGRLSAPLSDDDAARLIRRMESVIQAAGAVARSLDTLASCPAASVVSYAPSRACETLDPEYQHSMNGACVQ